MRARWIVVAAGLAACTGCGDNDLGVPRAVLITDLEDADAIALCDEFVALICGDARGAEFCNACVLYDLCRLPELFGVLEIQCQDVTVGEVRDCAHIRIEEVCPSANGGCMFDVGEWLCHPQGVQ